MDKPAFFAILPAAVRYDARLKPMERILYSEITALADRTGYCYASNRYFIELYGVTDRAVQKWIKDLTACGYITVEVLGGAGQGRCERRITPIFSLWDVRQTPEQKFATPEQKFGDTPEQKFAQPPNKSSGRIIQDNNTSNNNTTRACARGFDRFWAAYPRKVGKGPPNAVLSASTRTQPCWTGCCGPLRFNVKATRGCAATSPTRPPG